MTKEGTPVRGAWRFGPAHPAQIAAEQALTKTIAAREELNKAIAEALKPDGWELVGGLGHIEMFRNDKEELLEVDVTDVGNLRLLLGIKEPAKKKTTRKKTTAKKKTTKKKTTRKRR